MLDVGPLVQQSLRNSLLALLAQVSDLSLSRITHITEVLELDDDAEVVVQDFVAIFHNTLRADLAFAEVEDVISYESCVELYSANIALAIHLSLLLELDSNVAAQGMSLKQLWIDLKHTLLVEWCELFSRRNSEHFLFQRALALVNIEVGRAAIVAMVRHRDEFDAL